MRLRHSGIVEVRQFAEEDVMCVLMPSCENPSDMKPCSRGIPVEKYSSWELNLIWWGIGLHIGRVLPINRFGHLINHIQSLDSSKSPMCLCTLEAQSMPADQVQSLQFCCSPILLRANPT